MRTTLTALGAVFLINIVILGYAVMTASPRSEASGGSPVGHSEPAGPPSSTAPPGAAGAARQGPPASAPAVPAVVTPINLPDAGVIRAKYIRHCSACHGMGGRGDGPAAAQLYPRPRDFVDSPLRFASTSGGQDDLIAGLERTIAQGVPRSSMPGFHGVLDESAIAGLARYILSLRAGQQPRAAGTVDVGMRPPTTPGLVAHGQQLYNDLGCITCHGTAGHGDGPNSRNLVDSIGRPVRPGDLGSGLYKSGASDADLVRLILTGVPGTPMIPYQDVVARSNPDGSVDLTDAWALAAFIRSLKPKLEPRGESSGAELIAIAAPDAAMFHDPVHVGWLGVEATSIQLRPLWQREEEITHVDVRIVRTRERIAFCLDWRDRTQDVGRDLKVFCDAVAIMFALGDEVPALPMGVRIEGYDPEAPVNLWHWKAARQYEASTGAPFAAGAAQRQEGVCPIYGPGKPREKGAAPPAAEKPEWPELPSFLTAVMAGNVHEDPSLRSRAVLEANALGFGTLALQYAGGQGVEGAAAWSNGTWRVIMTRVLDTGDTEDISFETARRIPITFAVWDGSKGDRNGIKLISGWHWLLMQPPTRAALAPAAEQSTH
jgi:DMSO reductase family type II enzyme heme b subunit